MNYKPFTNDNTKEIIKEIKDNLPNINKSIIAIDTLDLCHILGEIERLNNIIKEAREYINIELLIKYRQDFELIEISHIKKILEILDKGE